MSFKELLHPYYLFNQISHSGVQTLIDDGFVEGETVRLEAQTHFTMGVFWEHRTGEMPFSRGTKRRIHHLCTFGILVTRLVPDLEDGCSEAVSVSSQCCNSGIGDNKVYHCLPSAN